VDEGVAAITGRRKAAILCVSLGSAVAAQVFQHLPEETIEKLTVEMARLTEVRPEHAEVVHQEIVETAYARGYVAEGGVRYAREVLEQAYGMARAEEILGRLANVIESTPFEFLRTTPPEQIVAFLRNEHAQTIALVVANLPTTELAAKVMQLIPPEQQADIALRIALMGQTPPDVVKEVASVMANKLENVIQQEYSAVGGVGSLAEILNNSDRPTERNILEHLAEENPELAEEVRALLFVFEDILKLDDRSIQLVLKEIDAKELALALRGASEDVRQRIMANMSQRGAEMLKEEMEFMPPQRRRVVEEAQSKIVGVVRKLEDSGAIFIQRGGGGGDEEVVL
jgi:flagellar motor switch protein FliG